VNNDLGNNSLELWLSMRQSVPSLKRTLFIHQSGRNTLCYGGCSPKPLISGKFKGTKGVQGLLFLLLKSKVDFNKGVIEGDRGSLAAALDHAIESRPAWLSNIFGGNVVGNQIVSRLFKRINPRRKWGGLVIIQLNHTLIPARSIRVRNGVKFIESHDELKNLISCISTIEAAALTNVISS
jgi:hypothetical protein